MSAIISRLLTQFSPSNSIDNRPEDWQQLEQKYDPSGAYKANYLQSKTKSDSGDN